MAFEELNEQTEKIQVQAKAYLDSNMAYYKLWGFKVAMKSTALVVKTVLVLLCLLMVLLFCSIAAAFAIGEAINSIALGFLIVGLFYLALTGLLVLIKDKIVEGPILEKFSTIFFND
jgi:lipopolysaccharide export LptBFGC system permease protein LptF